MASKMDIKVLEAMKAAAPLNLAKAEAIADQFGLKSRSVIASAVRNGIAYEKKAKVSKAGLPVTNKDDLVERIASALFVNVETLEGLDKASKTALERVAMLTEQLGLLLKESEKREEDLG
jgi:hypothetical protein